MAGLPELTDPKDRDRFGLFALHPGGKVLEGWINLHLLLWKHLIALLARVEDEGEKYAENKVWAPTWIRFERKVLTLKEKVDIEVRWSVGRGGENKEHDEEVGTGGAASGVHRGGRPNMER